VLKFLSVNSIVIPPAKTGKDNNKSTAVISTAQTKRFKRSMVTPRVLIFKIVVIKLTAPKIEAIPAICKLNIAKSTAGPECAITPDNGGYTVQPVPTPPSTKLESNNNANEGGNIQKLKLFNLGKAISTAPNIIGTNQLPNPPIRIGITIKKIITKACAVTITLYKCVCICKKKLPGLANSIRITNESIVPTTPEKAPKIIYKVPISL